MLCERNKRLTDAEGRLIKALQGGTTISSATFDALGHQVERVVPTGTIDITFDPAGRTMGFFNGSSGTWTNQQVWAGGRLIGHYDYGHTYFFHRSEDGSLAPDQITDEADTLKSDETFYPYGQQWQYANVTSYWWQFYGSISRYQNDLGLYLTPNRFYPPVEGRWLSPDPLGGDVADPQSLNRYSYALNNPTTLSDPLGLGDSTACWMFDFLLPGCESIGASGGGGGSNPADNCNDPSFVASNAECGPFNPAGIPYFPPLGGIGGGGIIIIGPSSPEENLDKSKPVPCIDPSLLTSGALYIGEGIAKILHWGGEHKTQSVGWDAGGSVAAGTKYGVGGTASASWLDTVDINGNAAQVTTYKVGAAGPAFGAGGVGGLQGQASNNPVPKTPQYSAGRVNDPTISVGGGAVVGGNVDFGGGTTTVTVGAAAGAKGMSTQLLPVYVITGSTPYCW